MPSLIDLEGIPFRWLGTDPKTGLDCFTYANYIRIQSGLTPFFVDKVPTDVYPAANTMPQGFLFEAAKRFTVPVHVPNPFHILIVNLHGEDCLGTLLSSRDLAFMTFGGSKLRSLSKFSGGNIRAILKPHELPPAA